MLTLGGMNDGRSKLKSLTRPRLVRIFLVSLGTHLWFCSGSISSLCGVECLKYRTSYHHLHGIVGVDGIALEVVREGPNEELIEHASLIHVEVIGDLVVAPACQVARVVVRCVETITAGKTDGIRKDDTRYRVGGLNIVLLDEARLGESVEIDRSMKPTAIPTPGTIGSLASSATRPG